jgi:hypothetical protein
MRESPSPDGSNGRDSCGRFARGNLGGPGNPLAKRTAALRSIMLDAITEDDLREIILKLGRRTCSLCQVGLGSQSREGGSGTSEKTLKLVPFVIVAEPSVGGFLFAYCPLVQWRP